MEPVNFATTDNLAVTIRTVKLKTIVELRDEIGHTETIAHLCPRDKIAEPIGIPTYHNRQFWVRNIRLPLIPLMMLDRQYERPDYLWLAAAINRLRAIAKERNPAGSRYPEN